MSVTDDPGSKKRLSRRKLFKRAALGFGAVAGIDTFLIEPAWLEGIETEAVIKGLPAAFEGYRVGLASDFHWPWRIDQVFLDFCWETLMGMQPDVICLPGDFLETRRMRQEVPFDGVFEKLTAPDGVFACFGNHDMHFPEFIKGELESKSSIRMLENEAVFLEREGAKLALAAVADLWYGEPDLARALDGIPADTPRILLGHNPDYAEECPEGFRVDLQLAGHTHGGQLATPFRWAPYCNSQYGSKFISGFAEGARHRVYTSRGITRGGFHWRFCSRPEVTVIRLTAG